MEDFDKFFQSEIIEKKKHLQSQRAKTGRGASRSRRIGIMPTDRMSKRELKEYTKAGEVVISFMYDALIPKEEFDNKPLEEQVKIMKRWRELYTNAEIMKGLGIAGSNTLYKMLNKLDLPPKSRGGYRKRNSKPKDKKPKEVAVESPQAVVVSQTDAVQKLISNGLHLEYNGKYDAEQLEKIFTKLQLIVSGDDAKYRLSLLITESK